MDHFPLSVSVCTPPMKPRRSMRWYSGVEWRVLSVYVCTYMYVWCMGVGVGFRTDPAPAPNKYADAIALPRRRSSCGGTWLLKRRCRGWNWKGRMGLAVSARAPSSLFVWWCGSWVGVDTENGIGRRTAYRNPPTAPVGTLPGSPCPTASPRVPPPGPGAGSRPRPCAWGSGVGRGRGRRRR